MDLATNYSQFEPFCFQTDGTHSSEPYIRIFAEFFTGGAWQKPSEPDVELRTPYGYVIDNENIRMQKANELIGYDESKYNKNPSLELQRIYELNKLKQNDKPLKDATGQFIPAAKVLHTKEINYALKGPSQSVITENGIQTLIHYPIPPHHQECYEKDEWNTPKLSLPITERIHKYELSIPMNQVLSMEEAKIVVDTINAFK